MRNALRHTPSLQHVITFVRPTVEATKAEFEKLERGTPAFNYSSFDALAKPLMEGTFTEQQALSQCGHLRNEKARGPVSELVTAFCEFAQANRADWFNAYQKDFFPIAPGIAIPVNPTGYWMRGGELKVLWVQKWKTRTLDERQKAIFHTILDRRVFVGDDFGMADLNWVDLKAPKIGSPREVCVLTRKQFETLSDAELKAEMDILLEAFRQFDQERAARRTQEREERPAAPMPLFDIEPTPDS